MCAASVRDVVVGGADRWIDASQKEVAGEGQGDAVSREKEGVGRSEAGIAGQSGFGMLFSGEEGGRLLFSGPTRLLR